MKHMKQHKAQKAFFFQICAKFSSASHWISLSSVTLCKNVKNQKSLHWKDGTNSGASAQLVSKTVTSLLFRIQFVSESKSASFFLGWKVVLSCDDELDLAFEEGFDVLLPQFAAIWGWSLDAFTWSNLNINCMTCPLPLLPKNNNRTLDFKLS